MVHAALHAALGQLGQVEPGAEMLALAAQHHRPHFGRQVDEGGLQLRDQGVVDGVALGRAHQPHMRQRDSQLDAQQVQRGEQAGGGLKRRQ